MRERGGERERGGGGKGGCRGCRCGEVVEVVEGMGTVEAEVWQEVEAGLGVCYGVESTAGWVGAVVKL